MPEQRQTGIRWRRWIVAWTLLTAVAVALHWAAWMAPNGTPPVEVPLISSGPARVLGNLIYTFAAPVWQPMIFIVPGARYGGLIYPVVAYGLAIGVWMLIVIGVLVWRRRMLSMSSGASARRLGGAAVREAATQLSASEPACGGTLVPNSSRRALLVNGTVGAAALMAAGPIAYGALIEPWSLRVTRYTIPIRGLPNSLHGVRLALFADPHCGPRVPESFIERAVQTTLDLKPDVICLLGDYIHAVTPQVERAVQLLAPLVRAGVPVVGVLGNHDWRGAGDECSKALSAMGVTMIDNDRVFLDASRRMRTESSGGDELCIAGIGDLHEHVVDVARALRGVPADVPRLVLAHQPATAEHPTIASASRPRIDLMVSGHTHGGQVVLPLVGAPAKWMGFGGGYVYGLDERNRFPVLISAGIGLSLIPVRLGAAPEIVELTLVGSGGTTK